MNKQPILYMQTDPRWKDKPYQVTGETATIGTTAVMSAVDWPLVCSTAALAAVLSLLTSIAGLPEVKNLDDDQ